MRLETSTSRGAAAPATATGSKVPGSRAGHGNPRHKPSRCVPRTSRRALISMQSALASVLGMSRGGHMHARRPLMRCSAGAATQLGLRATAQSQRGAAASSARLARAPLAKSPAIMRDCRTAICLCHDHRPLLMKSNVPRAAGTCALRQARVGATAPRRSPRAHGRRARATKPPASRLSCDQLGW